MCAAVSHAVPLGARLVPVRYPLCGCTSSGWPHRRRSSNRAMTSTERSATTVSMGLTCLLASGRLGSRVATNRSNKDVFIDTSGHTLCCHGERETTITGWRLHEREDSTYRRPSLCDCENVDGLCTDYHVTPDQWPVHPNKPMLALLGDLGAVEIKCRGRPQRLAFRTPKTETWVRPSGGFVCKHGNSQRVMRAIRKGLATKFDRCECIIQVPKREDSIFNKLKVAKRSANEA